MFGAKGRRIRHLTAELTRRDEAAAQRIQQLTDDLETARYVQRTALEAREKAEDIAAAQRGELFARSETIRGLSDTELAREAERLKTQVAALERRVADLQAAHETAYANLAARAGTTPAPVEDEAELVGGAA